jgi:hypothetical protein
MHDRQRRDEQHDVDRRDPAAILHDERQRRGHGDAEPDAGRQLEPRDERERGHAGQAAEQVDDVGAQRRPSRELASHAVRHGDEEDRHGDEEQRQQERALDRHDGRGRAAREIDRRRARQRDFQTQHVDREHQRELDHREPDEQVAPPRGEQAADADAEKAREENEVGKVGQQPDVSRHPANQRGFEKEDEEGGDEEGHGGHYEGLRAKG